MTRKTKNKLRILLKISFVLTFISAVILLSFKKYKEYKQEVEDLKVTQELMIHLSKEYVLYEEVIPEVEIEEPPVPVVIEVSSKEILISNDSYIGVIEMPTIGIRKPIATGVTKKAIATKVGWEPHSSMPGEKGNVVLAAHNYTNYFGKIYSLQTDDIIIITTRDGIYKYRVFDNFKVHKSEVWIYDNLEGYDETITLITCVYRNNEYRWVIRGELISVEDL